jgi:hypothetical protein
MTTKRISSSHSQIGEAAPIPRLDAFLADRITDWLSTTYESRRKPEIQSKVLALVLQLAFDKKGDPQPFPRREDLAEYLSCSKFTIDAAIYRSMERDLIRPVLRPVEGHLARGGGVNQLRYFEIISDALKAEYDSYRRTAGRKRPAA